MFKFELHWRVAKGADSAATYRKRMDRLTGGDLKANQARIVANANLKGIPNLFFGQVVLWRPGAPRPTVAAVWQLIKIYSFNSGPDPPPGPPKIGRK